MSKVTGGCEQDPNGSEKQQNECVCPLAEAVCPKKERKRIKIKINNYITQTGKANVAGGGCMQYGGNNNRISADVEDLKNGYKILSEMVEILKLRDK